MNITRYLNKKFFNHENSSIYNSEDVHDAQLISFEMKDDTMHSTNLKLLVGDCMVYYSFYGDNLLLMIFVEFLNKSTYFNPSLSVLKISKRNWDSILIISIKVFNY